MPIRSLGSESQDNARAPKSGRDIRNCSAIFEFLAIHTKNIVSSYEYRCHALAAWILVRFLVKGRNGFCVLVVTFVRSLYLLCWPFIVALWCLVFVLFCCSIHSLIHSIVRSLLRLSVCPFVCSIRCTLAGLAVSQFI